MILWLNVNGRMREYLARNCSQCDPPIRASVVASTIDYGEKTGTQFHSTSNFMVHLSWITMSRNSLINYNRHVTKIYDKVNIGGWKNGLSVMLDTYMDDFLVPFSRSDGFKVLIHGQQEYAQVGDLGFSISPGFETFAGMEPHMIDITAEVDSLSQSKRSCFRTRDKTLQFYNKYSFSNCIIECLTQHMVSRCKCRPFFLAGTTHFIKNWTSYTIGE